MLQGDVGQASAGIYPVFAACVEAAWGQGRDEALGWVAGFAIRLVRVVRSVAEAVATGGVGWTGLRTASSGVRSPCQSQPASSVAPSLRVPSACVPAQGIVLSSFLPPLPACAELYEQLQLGASARVPRPPLAPSIARSRRRSPIVLGDLAWDLLDVVVLDAVAGRAAVVGQVVAAGKVAVVGEEAGSGDLGS